MNQTALVALSLVLSIGLPIKATEAPTQKEIFALVSANLRATQANDIPAVRETIHPESLAQNAIGQMVEHLKAYKLKYEATSVSFVGMVDDYALIRVVQRTTRIEGPKFMDNEIDGVWALRQDGKVWKYWSQMALQFRAIAPSD